MNPSERQRVNLKPPLLWPLLLLASGMALAAGLWLWPKATSPALVPEPTPEPRAAAMTVPPPSLPMPPVEQADAAARKVLSGLSSAPIFAEWLRSGDLARRLVAAMNAIADGESPRTHLAFLAPSSGFKVARVNGRAVIDPTSYRRYDTIADIVASLDAKLAAKAYAELHPLLESAYGEIGRPGTTLEARLALAIDRLVSVPAPEGDVEIEATTRRYADPALEAKPAAAKHLMRMGPRNMKLIQGKLRDLATELALPQPLAAAKPQE